MIKSLACHLVSLSTYHLWPALCFLWDWLLYPQVLPHGPILVAREQCEQALCCPVFPAQPTLLHSMEPTQLPRLRYKCPRSQFRKQWFATILYQHSRTEAPQDHNIGTECAWWHCHEATAGSAAGEQSHCWDNRVVHELTQTTFTIESSHMRLPEEKCLYFLLKPPDVLLEAECRCRGQGRRVLALEMLPLAVVQGQQ